MDNKHKEPKVGFFLGTFDGGFLAATRTEPYFCVYGSTEESAIEAGLSAFAAYFSYKRGVSVPKYRVIEKKPIESKERKFTPTEIVFVAA